jgi:ornithine carbamoyltransferase
MLPNLYQRDFLKELDFSADELNYLIRLASALSRPCSNLALIFEKNSTRTRCAFEVAAYDQAAHVTHLDLASSQLGHKESVADTARVLARFYDAIAYRGASQRTVELVRHCGRPHRRMASHPDAGRFHDDAGT